MSIKIRTTSATTGLDLGTAYFQDASRLVRVDASDPCYRSITRSINLGITTADDHYTAISFSIAEAEALIACLSHAVGLRREAEAAKAA